MQTNPSRKRLFITVAILTLIALTGIYYKVRYLRFTLLPEKNAAIWQVESVIAFNADGSPVKVSLAAPEKHPGFRVFSADQFSDDAYHFQYNGLNDERRAEWLAPSVEGPQMIHFRLKIFDAETGPGPLPAPAPEPGPQAFWEDPAMADAADKIVKQAAEGAEDDTQIVLNVLRTIFRPTEASGVHILLPTAPTMDDRIGLAVKLLGELNLSARPVFGLQLVEGRRRDNITKIIDVYIDGAWRGFDTETLEPGFPDQFLAMRRGDRSMLDVEGGTDSSVRFSVSKTTVPASVLISARNDAIGRTLGSLSIYDLPIESQNIFMRIAMIPAGILIVVLVRNIIGIQTMGTFMPVLIAMAFIDTKLIPGLVSFLTIIAVGLLIRFYLDDLNLLLVPRIAAVVLVVIYLMKAYSMFSYELGFPDGLSVTFFPLIIMAWTIERASILWEEDGPTNAIKQFSASLGTGIVCYLVISNRYVQHIAFSFAEIDLLILALVLLLGSYTGYRITELRRFRTLVKR